MIRVFLSIWFCLKNVKANCPESYVHRCLPIVSRQIHGSISSLRYSKENIRKKKMNLIYLHWQRRKLQKRLGILRNSIFSGKGQWKMNVRQALLVFPSARYFFSPPADFGSPWRAPFCCLPTRRVFCRALLRCKECCDAAANSARYEAE